MAWRGGVGSLDRIVADLNREWESLSERHEVEGWAARHQVLQNCRDLHSVLARVPFDPDQVLGALLSEARTGSTSAARTVLQAMLGKVVLMANVDPVNGVDAYLVAMWECIRRYPVERRPNHVAANLALDTRKLAKRELKQCLQTVPWPPGPSFTAVVDRQLDRDRTDHGHEVAMLTAGDVLKAALELELIDVDAEALLGSVYIDGTRTADVAAQRRLSPCAVRQRCSRAVRLLAVHSAEIASCA